VKKSDLILGICSIVFGIIIILATGKMNSTVASFPKLSAYLLICLGILLLVSCLFALRRNKFTDTKEQKTNMGSYRNVIIILIIFLCYVVTLEILGYIIPTFFLMTSIIYIVGYKNIRINVITSLCMTIALFVVFKFLFQVHFPNGIFF